MYVCMYVCYVCRYVLKHICIKVWMCMFLRVYMCSCIHICLRYAIGMGICNMHKCKHVYVYVSCNNMLKYIDKS